MARLHTITMLGTGTSTGIPMVGCHCPVCSSLDPNDKRLRSSILLKTDEGKQILIDTSPDLRQQCFNHQIEHLDAVIITHEHADHTHGIDELRPLTYIREAKKLPPLAIYTYPKCADVLTTKFPYIFDRNHFYGKKILGGGIPMVDLHPTILASESKIFPTTIADLPFEFFLCPHGHGTSMSFVCDRFAYIVDCHEIPNAVIDYLRNKKLDLVLIDCLQKKPQNTHLYVSQVFDYIKKISPKRWGAFHMNHDLSHQELQQLIRDYFKVDHNRDMFVTSDNMILTV